MSVLTAEVLMLNVRCIAGLTALLLSMPLYAEQQASQPLRVIPKSYISPGASGSIGTYQQIESHTLYGGQRLPNGLQRQEQRYDSQTLEHRGAIQQRIEYPGGYSVQQYPGQSSHTQERSR
jgi:hypothetical protein